MKKCILTNENELSYYEREKGFLMNNRFLEVIDKVKEIEEYFTALPDMKYPEERPALGTIANNFIRYLHLFPEELYCIRVEIWCKFIPSIEKNIPMFNRMWEHVSSCVEYRDETDKLMKYIDKSMSIDEYPAQYTLDQLLTMDSVNVDSLGKPM